jgi:hypothetical protein
MKAIVTGIFVALVLSSAAFATGSALDPRVPGLQRQIRALNARVNNVESSVSEANAGLQRMLPRNCISFVNLVVRPGYLYVNNVGTVVVYKAIDEYNPSVDTNPTRIATLNC